MSGGNVGRAVSRRTVVAATAVAGIGAAGACGRPDTPSDGAGPAAASTAAAPTGPSARALAATVDIPVGGGTVFPDARVIVTQPSPGDFRGFGIVCTHDGCELNAVADGTINCPCHGSRYAITDGSVVRGPARTGLRKETVAVDGGRVVLL
jgi:Rieske Fe-S protein